jgi:hypothetical protein
MEPKKKKKDVTKKEMAKGSEIMSAKARKFVLGNIAKGVLNAIGTLIVYGIVAWLIIKHGWVALKDAMAVRTMSVVQTLPTNQLPPKM